LIEIFGYELGFFVILNDGTGEEYNGVLGKGSFFMFLKILVNIGGSRGFEKVIFVLSIFALD
jgi:hypothetical protein